jgi:4a-hydroxytetrahydrobiopterin dehydratase
MKDIPELSLHQKKCKPCEGRTPPLNIEQSNKLLTHIEGWNLKNVRIEKDFKFKNFKEAMNFANAIAELAESEGHHPAIYISWNRVKVTLTTHAIKGLSENDFILAAKIDRI